MPQDTHRFLYVPIFFLHVRKFGLEAVSQLTTGTRCFGGGEDRFAFPATSDLVNRGRQNYFQHLNNN